MVISQVYSVNNERVLKYSNNKTKHISTAGNDSSITPFIVNYSPFLGAFI